MLRLGRFHLNFRFARQRRVSAPVPVSVSKTKMMLTELTNRSLLTVSGPDSKKC